MKHNGKTLFGLICEQSEKLDNGKITIGEATAQIGLYRQAVNVLVYNVNKHKEIRKTELFNREYSANLKFIDVEED